MFKWVKRKKKKHLLKRTKKKLVGPVWKGVLRGLSPLKPLSIPKQGLPYTDFRIPIMFGKGFNYRYPDSSILLEPGRIHLWARVSRETRAPCASAPSAHSPIFFIPSPTSFFILPRRASPLLPLPPSSFGTVVAPAPELLLRPPSP